MCRQSTYKRTVEFGAGVGEVGGVNEPQRRQGRKERRKGGVMNLGMLVEGKWVTDAFRCSLLWSFQM